MTCVKCQMIFVLEFAWSSVGDSSWEESSLSGIELTCSTRGRAGRGWEVTATKKTRTMPTELREPSLMYSTAKNLRSTLRQQDLKSIVSLYFYVYWKTNVLETKLYHKHEKHAVFCKNSLPSFTIHCKDMKLSSEVTVHISIGASESGG